MAKHYLASALIAAALFTGGAAFAQGSQPSAADLKAAEQLVADIHAAVAALGPGASREAEQAAIDNVIAMAAVSPNIAILATRAVAATSPSG